MSESHKEKMERIVAEAVEARQHPCERCGHDGSDHVFDIVMGDGGNPCMKSCMTCMGIEK